MPPINVKLALRQLQKNKGFTALNILGLTLGVTTFLLIVLFVTDELRYDRYNTKADRIVRIHTDMDLNGAITPFADAAPPVAATLMRVYPEVEKAVRILPEDDHIFRKGHENIRVPHLAFVDPGFFDVFTMHILEGDPARALLDPRSAIITATTAQRFFNTTHAIGHNLYSADDTTSYTVRAVIADMPSPSHFHYDILLSILGNGISRNNNFYSIFRMSTYALLKPGADRAAFDGKLSEFMRSYVTGYAQTETGSKGTFSIHLSEMPLTDIHLHSNRTDELEVNSSSQYVYIFTAIAVFVLLIACINFMNLSTARSANRAREVGVRKVLGSTRSGLIAQFLSESVTMTAAAAILAIGLTAVLLPWFNQLTGKQLSLSGSVLRWLLPSLLGIVAVVGLGSGAWPAFFLSAFRPVQVLKGKLALGGKGSSFRNALVVVQFTVSVFLIVGTLIVYRQLHYIQSKDLGFNRSQVLIIKNLDALAGPPGAPAITPVLSSLRNEVLTWSGVTGATLTSFLPTGQRRWHNFGSSKNNPSSLQTELWEVDEEYVQAMKMQILEGRNFSRDYGTDSTAILLNETAARDFGIAAHPLGENIFYPHYWHPTKFHVIGIVKDFNFNSIRANVTPLVLIDRPDYAPYLAIRIDAGHIPTILAMMKNKWAALDAHRPFEYSFMDEDFNAIYQAELRMGHVVIVLTSLAILIACLGLFGLAAYAAEQRTKEISIRKVLGAGVPNIIALLSRDFALLIILSIGIATPLAWLTMHAWLRNFAFRTTIAPWTFAAAAGIVIIVALLTTLFQTLRAAVANPVDALHSE